MTLVAFFSRRLKEASILFRSPEPFGEAQIKQPFGNGNSNCQYSRIVADQSLQKKGCDETGPEDFSGRAN